MSLGVEGVPKYKEEDEVPMTLSQKAEMHELIDRYSRVYPNVNKTHMKWIYQHIITMDEKELEEEMDRIQNSEIGREVDPGGEYHSGPMVAAWAEKYGMVIKDKEDADRPEITQ